LFALRKRRGSFPCLFFEQSGGIIQSWRREMQRHETKGRCLLFHQVTLLLKTRKESP